MTREDILDLARTLDRFQERLIHEPLGLRGSSLWQKVRELLDRMEGVAHMDCPLCLATTKVIDSRPGEAGIRRRRACSKCDHRFSTVEALVTSRAVPQPALRSFATTDPAEAKACAEDLRERGFLLVKDAAAELADRQFRAAKVGTEILIVWRPVLHS